MNKLIKEKDLKTFAFIWALIFSFFGLYPLINGGNVNYLLGVIAVLFLLVRAINPFVLLSFYKAWVKLGGFIGNIISKIILTVLYFGLFTPVALVLKLLGKDLLNKKLDCDAKSYWIERQEQPQTMKNQF